MASELRAMGNEASAVRAEQALFSRWQSVAVKSTKLWYQAHMHDFLSRYIQLRSLYGHAEEPQDGTLQMEFGSPETDASIPVIETLRHARLAKVCNSTEAVPWSSFAAGCRVISWGELPVAMEDTAANPTTAACKHEPRA